MADQIHSLFQRSYREEARLLGLADFAPLRRTPEQIQAAGTAFLGLWLQRELAALVEFRHSADRLSIDSLVVEPRYFRRGLASRLLERALGRPNWRIAEVETACANHPAITLYRRFGFRESRRWTTADGVAKVRLATSTEP